ncbi:MAG: hypothetical protein HRT88_14010, partial [Lentisphaeraceae bacterium]|nr:hypothetical protein [Lentisphaeraceae bacterium]
MKVIFSLLLMYSSLFSLQGQGFFGDVQKDAPLVLQSFKTTFQDAVFIDKKTVKAGDLVHVIIKVQLKDGWKNYWKFSGGISEAMDFNWHTPKGLKLIDMQFPYPKYTFDKYIGAAYVNHGDVLYVATFKVDDDAQGTLDLSATINWQTCEANGGCIQPNQPPVIKVPIVIGEESIINEEGTDAYRKALKHLPEPAPAGWKISADKISLDGKKKSKGAYKVTITAPHKLSKYKTHFFPAMPHVAYEERYYGYEKISDNIISKTFELNNAAHPDSIKPYSKLVGVVTFEKDGKTIAYSLTGDIKGVAADAIKPPMFIDSAVPQIKQVVQTPPEVQTTASVDNKLAFRTTDGASVSAKDMGLLKSLLFAFFGGFILNLMPCVFPVLSIKVMGFVKQAKEGKGHAMLHSGLFTLGVLISFWVLAGIMLALKAAGKNADWGYQLQSPYIVMTVILVLFAMALNLFGVFEIGIGMTSVGQNAQKKTGLTGSFMSGILATIVATPCMAPMLGAAIA